MQSSNINDYSMEIIREKIINYRFYMIFENFCIICWWMTVYILVLYVFTADGVNR